MWSPAEPVHVLPIGALAATAHIWRWRDAYHVTVSCKAMFALQHRTVMSPIVPEPLTEDEIVPYREHPEVVVVAAHAFSSEPAEASAVRLVVRGRETLLDKSLLVYAPRPGGVVAPFQQAAIVKRKGKPQALVIDPKDPSQRGTFGRIDPHLATIGDGGDGISVIDSDVEWETYQSAPVDQRLTRLDGEEWLILEGMTADRSRFVTRLPGAMVETRIYGPDLWCGQSLMLMMEPCSLNIDIDNHICALVWRGAFTVENAETAHALTLVSALYVPGTMTQWPTVQQVAASAAAHHTPRSSDDPSSRTPSSRTPSSRAPSSRTPSSRTKAEEIAARAYARVQSLGKLATLPVKNSTQPMDSEGTPPAPPQMVLHRDGVVQLRPFDPFELPITRTGTIDLPPVRGELASPSRTPITLNDVDGAPWSVGTHARRVVDAASRAAGGTIIADEIQAELDDDEHDVETLEKELTDSLDEMKGDPLAELFDVSRIKRS